MFMKTPVCVAHAGRQSHELALMKGMQRVQQRRREHSGTGVSASVSEQQGMTGTDQV
jgi:hypothetical protein